jgi:hypothetical protein
MNLHQTWHAFMPWNQKDISERSKLRESVLGSKPHEGGFCTSETKHDRRTSPRPKLLVSTNRLQEQRLQHRETVLGSSPDEGVFCSSEEQRSIQNCFCEITGTWVTNPITVLGSSLGEDFSNNIFPMIFQWYVSNDQAYGKISGDKDW